MKILDEYFKLQKEIYKYFGYVEDWVVIPIDDKRDFYWSLEGEINEKINKKNLYKLWIFFGMELSDEIILL